MENRLLARNDGQSEGYESKAPLEGSKALTAECSRMSWFRTPPEVPYRQLALFPKPFLWRGKLRSLDRATCERGFQYRFIPEREPLVLTPF